MGLQVAIGVQTVLLDEQVVSVQGGTVTALAVIGVHEATPVGPLFTGVQVVAVHKGALAGTGVQLDTGVGVPGTFGQVVVVQLLSAVAGEVLQEPIGVGPVGTGVQVVVTQLLPDPAAAGVHELTGVGPVFTVLQFVVV